MKNAKYKLAYVKNKLPYFAEVQIEIESSAKFDVQFACSGSGFSAQGHIEEAPKVGYDEWKNGAKRGIEFAAKQASVSNCVATVTLIRGLTTDTNPVIIAAASAFAFWELVGFQPEKALKEKIEEKVLSSWQSREDFFDQSTSKNVNILDEIVEQKQREVALLPERIIAAGDLRDAMLEHGERRDFIAALKKPRFGSVGLIAEVKKASPSAGVICPNFDPVRIAKEYEAAGASCLSVLTDEKFFQGSLDYLRQIREAVKLPLLRKDFIIDERQILEAIEWGADAILLIVAILTDEQLAKFHTLAVEAGLAVLVEVHDEAELQRALKISPALLGVNNRNLKNFKVDLATTEQLAPAIIRSGSLLVAESGIHTREDVVRLKKCGAGAILVGESLVKQGDIGSKVRELIG